MWILTPDGSTLINLNNVKSIEIMNYSVAIRYLDGSTERYPLDPEWKEILNKLSVSRDIPVL